MQRNIYIYNSFTIIGVADNCFCILRCSVKHLELNEFWIMLYLQLYYSRLSESLISITVSLASNSSPFDVGEAHPSHLTHTFSGYYFISSFSSIHSFLPPLLFFSYPLLSLRLGLLQFTSGILPSQLSGGVP